MLPSKILSLARFFLANTCSCSQPLGTANTILDWCQYFLPVQKQVFLCRNLCCYFHLVIQYSFKTAGPPWTCKKMAKETIVGRLPPRRQPLVFLCFQMDAVLTEFLHCCCCWASFCGKLLYPTSYWGQRWCLSSCFYCGRVWESTTNTSFPASLPKQGILPNQDKSWNKTQPKTDFPLRKRGLNKANTLNST